MAGLGPAWGPGPWGLGAMFFNWQCFSIGSAGLTDGGQWWWQPARQRHDAIFMGTVTELNWTGFE